MANGFSPHVDRAISRLTNDPGTAGTSFVVTDAYYTGAEGDVGIVCPHGQRATPANSERVLISGVAGTTITVEREYGGDTAINVANGYDFYVAALGENLRDIEERVPWWSYGPLTGDQATDQQNVFDTIAAMSEGDGLFRCAGIVEFTADADYDHNYSRITGPGSWKVADGVASPINLLDIQPDTHNVHIEGGEWDGNASGSTGTPVALIHVGAGCHDIIADGYGYFHDVDGNAFWVKRTGTGTDAYNLTVAYNLFEDNLGSSVLYEWENYGGDVSHNVARGGASNAFAGHYKFSYSASAIIVGNHSFDSAALGFESWTDCDFSTITSNYVKNCGTIGFSVAASEGCTTAGNVCEGAGQYCFECADDEGCLWTGNVGRNAGITVMSMSSQISCNNNRVTDNHFNTCDLDDPSGEAVVALFCGESAVMDHNVVARNGICNGPAGISVQAHASLSSMAGNRIEDNDIYDITGYGVVVFTNTGITRTRIRGNDVEDTNSGAAAAGIFDGGALSDIKDNIGWYGQQDAISLPASVFGSTGGATIANRGSSASLGQAGIAFDPDVQSFATTPLEAPSAWWARDLEAYLDWSGSDGNSGNVRWFLGVASIAVGEQIDQANEDSAQVNGAANGADVLVTTGPFVVTPGLSSHGYLRLMAGRIGDDAGNDTLNANAWLFRVRIKPVSV